MEDLVEHAYELTSALSNADFDVVWTRNAGEAKQAMLTDEFDLIVTDIYVFQDGRVTPDGGISLIGWTRLTGATPEHAWMGVVPILAISGATQHPGNEFILKVAESVGADASLTKPVDLETFVATVQSMLADD